MPKLRDYINTDHLASMFFEKAISQSYPIEQITTHGLDEIRNELKTNMDDEIKIKIQNAENTLSKNDELLKDNNTLTSDNSSLIIKNKKLTEQCDILTKKLIDIEKENLSLLNANETLDKVKDTLKNGYGFWNKSEILDKIISTIRFKNEWSFHYYLEIMNS